MMSDKPSKKEKKSKKEKAEPELKPEYITKNYKTLTPEQIEKALQTPTLCSVLMSIVTKFSDDQLQIACSKMDLEQIKSTIPKLQLQQTGVAVQGMNAAQVRQTIDALTSDDRNLLMQNISLITSSSNKEDLQSFMSFVDPLAMSIAVNLPELTDKILESSAVLTEEQIRVVIPVLSVSHIKEMVKTLEHDSQMKVAISMIDCKEEIIKSASTEYTKFESTREQIVSRLAAVKDQLTQLEHRVHHLKEQNEEARSSSVGEYEYLARTAKNTKSEIESLQQSAREIQASIKLPLRLLSDESASNNKTDSKSVLQSNLDQLSTRITELGRELHVQFVRLTSSDGILEHLQHLWESIKNKSPSALSSSTVVEFGNRSEMLASSDSIFVDDDRAMELYEAIKVIGNPDAVGNIYSISWTEIIHAGFRRSEDFQQKGITNLDQLQKYISKLKDDGTQNAAQVLPEENQ